MRRYLFATAVVLLLVASYVQGGRGAAAQGAAPAGKAYRFEKLAEGVYFATGTGVMTTMSNGLVIVNADHTMLVDTSVTPAAARALVAQIKDEITPKPIRYVFNSHYHFDHAHGNQIFGDEVEIVGHEYIRRMHLTNVLQQRTNKSFTDVLPGQIAQLKQRIAQATDPKEKATLETSLGVTEAHYKATQEVHGEAAERHLHRLDGHPQGRPRGAVAVSRARAHGWRHDGLPAGRADRLHRRLLRGSSRRRRAVVSRRLVHRRVAGEPRTAQGRRLRRHRARARRAAEGAEADRRFPELPA